MTYREQETNEYVWQQVNILAERQELLLSTVKRRDVMILCQNHRGLLEQEAHHQVGLGETRAA